MSRVKTELKAAKKEAARHSEEIQSLWQKAKDDDNRDATPDEQEEILTHVKAIETAKGRIGELEAADAVEEEIRRVGQEMGAVTSVDEPERKNFARPKRVKSLGEQFVESEGFKALQARGMSGDWSTGKIDLETKATLLEGDNYDASTGSPGAGAPLVPIDQRPGLLPILYERLTVADLLASGQTVSNSVRYVRETVATNAAASVAEGGPKPESTLEFATTDTPVVKIATFLPVSDEMLEDASQIQSYINARLSLFIQQEEETQLLNGTGAGADLVGLISQVPAANLDIASGATAANLADHIYAAITHIRTTSFLEPDGIILHPDDWEVLRVLKDTTNNYIAGPPFSNTGSGEPGDSLWGKRVVVTSAISGQVLVGAFRTAAQVYRRGGISVEASNSHASFFTTNLVAIRAEERLALAVYRAAAFATVDIAS